MEKNIYIKIRESLRDDSRHMAIPQSGSSVIVLNKDNEVLLLKKGNGNTWVIPGGIQELGEDFREVARRELKEETGLSFELDKFEFIGIYTGESRHRIYANGDEVYNNTALYLVENVDKMSVNISHMDWIDSGDGYRLMPESTGYGWFDINNLPGEKPGEDDSDLIEAFINWKYKIK